MDNTEPPPPGEADELNLEGSSSFGHRPSQLSEASQQSYAERPSEIPQSLDENKANSMSTNDQNRSFDGKGPVGFAAAFQQIIHTVGPAPNRFPGPFGIPRHPGNPGHPPFRPVGQTPFLSTDYDSIPDKEPQIGDNMRIDNVEENVPDNKRESCERENSSLFQANHKKPGALPSLLDIEVKLPPPVKNEGDSVGVKDSLDAKGNIDYTPSLRTSVTFGSAGPLNTPYGFEKRLPNTLSRPPRPPWAPRPNFIRPGYTPGQRYPNQPPFGQGYGNIHPPTAPLHQVVYNEQSGKYEIQGGLKRRSYDSTGQENETPAKKWSTNGNSQTDPYSTQKDGELSAGDEKSVYERVRKVVTPLWNLPISSQLEKKDGAFQEFLGHLKTSLISSNQALSVWFEHQESKDYNNKLYVESKQILASPVSNGYRNKCDFVIGIDPETKKTRVGLLVEQGSSSVGPVGHLNHISEGMKYIVSELDKYFQASDILPFNVITGNGHWMGATLRQSKFGEIMLNISFHPKDLSKLQLKSVKENLETYFNSGPGQVCRISSLFFTTRTQWESGDTENLYGTSSITEEICGKRFQISPRTFFAVNPAAAEMMYNTISGMVHLNMNCTLVDICCGSGSIGLSLSDRCGQVLGIDILEDAVNDANKNALANNVTNCEFMPGSVEDSLPNLWRRVTFSEVTCIIDPPRAGIGSKAIQSIRKNESVTKIIYIASDPYPAVKNFLDFARPPSNSFKGEPFVPVRAIPVDLYPHTSNFCIVFLFMRVKMADLLSPENIDVGSYLRGTNETSNTQIIPEHEAASGPIPDLTWKKVPTTSCDNQSIEENNASISIELSEEQINWLDQMTQHYGSAFERDQWIESFKAQNAEARANYLATLNESHTTKASTSDSTTLTNHSDQAGDTTKPADKGNNNDNLMRGIKNRINIQFLFLNRISIYSKIYHYRSRGVRHRCSSPDVCTWCCHWLVRRVSRIMIYS